MRIATVTAGGLHLRSRPAQSASIVDTLTKGDQLEIAEHVKASGNWYYGRVARVKNNVDAKRRTALWGWFYTVGTVNFAIVPDDEPPPPVVDDNDGWNLPPWAWFALSTAILAAVIGILYRIHL